MFFNTGLIEFASGPHIRPQELGAVWHELSLVGAEEARTAGSRSALLSKVVRNDMSIPQGEPPGALDRSLWWSETISFN